jgi:hypothetical protein
MRVLLLRKKLVDYDPTVRESGLTLYHGTNPLNLYDILDSGGLGSEFSRYTGVYEPIGEFYATLSYAVARGYAYDASHDETYFLPEDLLRLLLPKERRDALKKLLEEVARMDLRSKYVMLASLMLYLFNHDPYPQVVIKLTVKNPDLLEDIHFDEDHVRNWLESKAEREKGEFTRIIEVAKRDFEFSEWLQGKEDPLGVARMKVENKLSEETFSDTMEVSGIDIYSDAFHLLAKQVYLALMRLAAEGDEEAKELLKEASEGVKSFFFSESIPLFAVDEAIAFVYLPDGTRREIDLKDDKATEAVEEIMQEQIDQWTQKLATAGPTSWVYLGVD